VGGEGKEKKKEPARASTRVDKSAREKREKGGNGHSSNQKLHANGREKKKENSREKKGGNMSWRVHLISFQNWGGRKEKREGRSGSRHRKRKKKKGKGGNLINIESNGAESPAQIGEKKKKKASCVIKKKKEEVTLSDKNARTANHNVARVLERKEGGRGGKKSACSSSEGKGKGKGTARANEKGKRGKWSSNPPQQKKKKKKEKVFVGGKKRAVSLRKKSIHHRTKPQEKKKHESRQHREKKKKKRLVSGGGLSIVLPAGFFSRGEKKGRLFRENGSYTRNLTILMEGKKISREKKGEKKKPSSPKKKKDKHIVGCQGKRLRRHNWPVGKKEGGKKRGAFQL